VYLAETPSIRVVTPPRAAIAHAIASKQHAGQPYGPGEQGGNMALNSAKGTGLNNRGIS